jgi:hypothetical protein
MRWPQICDPFHSGLLAVLVAMGAAPGVTFGVVRSAWIVTGSIGLSTGACEKAHSDVMTLRAPWLAQNGPARDGWPGPPPRGGPGR